MNIKWEEERASAWKRRRGSEAGLVRINTFSTGPAPPSKRRRGLRRRAPTPPPQATPTPGARTPLGVLAPGASPRVRRSPRPSLAPEVTPASLPSNSWLAEASLAAGGGWTRRCWDGEHWRGGWGWAGPPFLARSPAPPCSSTCRWAVSEEPRPPQVSGRWPGAGGIPEPHVGVGEGLRGLRCETAAHPAVNLPVRARRS